MIPEGNPHAKTAGKSGRSQNFKEALTPRFWQPLSCALATLHLVVRYPPAEIGGSGPSETRVGLDCHLFLLSLILSLPQLRRRLCVCACVHLDTFSVFPSHFYLCVSSLHKRPCYSSLYRSKTNTDDPRRPSTWQSCRTKRPRPKIQGILQHSCLAALIITPPATVHREVRGCSIHLARIELAIFSVLG